MKKLFLSLGAAASVAAPVAAVVSCGSNDSTTGTSATGGALNTGATVVATPTAAQREVANYLFNGVKTTTTATPTNLVYKTGSSFTYKTTDDSFNEISKTMTKFLELEFTTTGDMHLYYDSSAATVGADANTKVNILLGQFADNTWVVRSVGITGGGNMAATQPLTTGSNSDLINLLTALHL